MTDANTWEVLTNLVISQLASSNSTISNQLEAGSIMVSAMESIADRSKPLSMYRLTKLTHKASTGFRWQMATF